MNSEACPSAAQRRSLHFRWLWLLLAGLLTGCAAVKQYSIDSWQGPLPARDMKYVTAE